MYGTRFGLSFHTYNFILPFLGLIISHRPLTHGVLSEPSLESTSMGTFIVYHHYVITQG